MTIRHIIASGCSFTADGIGGLPPSLTHPTGGCSFVDTNRDNVDSPNTWIGHVAKQLKVSSLVNLSAGSHGNMLIANNIISFLNINFYSYIPEETMILFNISDPARLDIPCSWEHPSRSSFCTWGQNILPYTYIDNLSKPVTYVTKNMEIEQIEIFSSSALLGMMSYLEKYNFNFKFLLMSDYKSHPILGSVINQFYTHLIEMEDLVGMKEFVKHKNLTADDNFHPNARGHELISKIVIEELLKE
jgi:hypothetical protein